MPDTSPFLSAQRAGMSSFPLIFIVLGMYNFACIVPDESIGRRSGNFAVPPQGYLFTTYGNNQLVQLIQNLGLANFKKFLTLI